MEFTYDEDLNENPFFQVLQSEQPELFQQATLEGWVICIPRVGSLPKYTLTDEDFYNHVLIPSDELPESHFRSLTDKEVRVYNRIISTCKPFSTNILFEETFYTDEMFKYRVLCLESPLDSQTCPNHNTDIGLINLLSLRDCIDLLWTESMGEEVMERLDQAIAAFKKSHSDLENESLEIQRDLTKGLYIHCIDITLKNHTLRAKTISNNYLLSNIKLAVETYMHHGIYKILIKGITAHTASEDAHLNKIIRNHSELQLKDLEVRSDLYDIIPAAKQELSHVDGYSTVLGKVSCIKRALSSISGEQIVSADDLLPVLIFLVIKVSLPNWIAHLTLMRDFRFSTTDQDESSFLITSLEVAVEHIKSGCLFRPSCPETFNSDTTNKSTIEYLFNAIKYGHAQEVQDIIEKQNNLPCLVENIPSLCHPLCSCDKCEELLKQKRNTSPTLHSCDEKGYTALHMSCKYGQMTILEFLLDQGAKINAKDLRDCTPLHHAASEGHQNALLFLLHRNALPDIVDTDGNTPLHAAASRGHEACVKALLYFSEHIGQLVNVEARNVHGDTPLHHASRWGFVGIVQILLEYGARPNLKNNRRISPMDCAHSIHISKSLSTLTVPSKKGTYKKLSFPNVRVAAASKLQLDFENVANIKSISKVVEEYGVRPRSAEQCKKMDKLVKAIAAGDIRLACYYIGIEGTESLQPITSHSKQTCHPLCICKDCLKNITKENKKSCEFVLVPVTQPVMANACTTDGLTALHAAAMYGRAELVPLLICAGASINIRTTTRGASPLHLACQNKRTSTVSALLDVPGCDINAQDSRGNTPIHYACLSGSVPLVQVLLKHSPNLNIRNIESRTPVEEAEDKMALRMVQLLRGKLLIIE